jgi:hypothetical protein
MMTLLASLHAIAAQRGDGLRPELIHLLENPTRISGLVLLLSTLAGM